MSNFYILDGKTPIRSDLREWAIWFQTADRSVKKTHIGKATISTIFLGLDYSFGFEGEWLPILFETLVFGGKLDGEMCRYCSWEEAEQGHDLMVEKVKQINGLYNNEEYS